MTVIGTSKTHRLYLLLKDSILTGGVGAGERLPSEPQLAKRHNVSRVTVRRALDGLAREGLIQRSAGSGTYVAPAGAPRSGLTGNLTDMLAELAAMGRATQAQLLAFDYVGAPPHVAAALGVAPGDQVQRAVRVRHIRKDPFSYLVTFVPAEIGERYSKRDLARTPLLELLERSGIVASRAVQTISATLAGPEVAQALKVEVGAPLLSLTRVVFDADNRGVEHLSALYRPDAHVIRMELTRQGRGTKRYWHATGGIPTLRTAVSKPNPAKTGLGRRRAA